MMGKRRAGTHGEVVLVFRGKWKDALEFEDFLREHVEDWIISTGETLSISVSAFPTPRQVKTGIYDLAGPVNYPPFSHYEEQAEQDRSEREKALEKG